MTARAPPTGLVAAETSPPRAPPAGPSPTAAAAPPSAVASSWLSWLLGDNLDRLVSPRLGRGLYVSISMCLHLQVTSVTGDCCCADQTVCGTKGSNSVNVDIDYRSSSRSNRELSNRNPTQNIKAGNLIPSKQ